MPIEKAFAIEAPPEKIWTALRTDLQAGEPERFAIEHSGWPSVLTVRVDLGGMPVLLTYTIEAREDFTEVSVTLTPLSLRYKLFQVLSFGHLRKNFEMLLVMGLANLKAAVEEEPPPVESDNPAG